MSETATGIMLESAAGQLPQVSKATVDSLLSTFRVSEESSQMKKPQKNWVGRHLEKFKARLGRKAIPEENRKKDPYDYLIEAESLLMSQADNLVFPYSPHFGHEAYSDSSIVSDDWPIPNIYSGMMLVFRAYYEENNDYIKNLEMSKEGENFIEDKLKASKHVANPPITIGDENVKTYVKEITDALVASGRAKVASNVIKGANATYAFLVHNQTQEGRKSLH